MQYEGNIPRVRCIACWCVYVFNYGHKLMRTRAPHVTRPLLSLRSFNLLEASSHISLNVLQPAREGGGSGSSKGWAELQGCECDQRAREFRQWDP